VASIRQPWVHQTFVLPVTSGDRFEFVVHGRGIDARLSIQRGSQASGGIGATILATRMCQDISDVAPIDAAFREVATDSKQDAIPRGAGIDTRFSDEWMAQVGRDPDSSLQTSSPPSTTADRVIHASPNASITDHESAAVNAAFDTLVLWYREELGGICTSGG
jgi:hypothetical protein